MVRHGDDSCARVSRMQTRHEATDRIFRSGPRCAREQSLAGLRFTRRCLGTAILGYSIGCRSMFADLQLPAVRYEGEMRFYEELIVIRRHRAAKALARRSPSELGVTTRPREAAPSPAVRAQEQVRPRGGWGWLRLRPRDPVSADALEQVVALASRQEPRRWRANR
jgi:hypothetical protein